MTSTFNIRIFKDTFRRELFKSYGYQKCERGGTYLPLCNRWCPDGVVAECIKKWKEFHDRIGVDEKITRETKDFMLHGIGKF